MATQISSQQSFASSLQGEPHAPRWTQAEYYRFDEFGFFEGRQIEWIEGEIVETIISESHRSAVIKISDVLSKTLGKDYRVAIQQPLAAFAFPDSEPKPDILITRHGQGEAIKTPNSGVEELVLLIETSQATLAFDQTIKAALYARAIAEYWIVNLEERQLEVHRVPVGEKYTRISLYSETDSVSPLAAPDAQIKVADLLP